MTEPQALFARLVFGMTMHRLIIIATGLILSLVFVLPTIAPAYAERPFVYLALGDSVPSGDDIDPSETYPRHLGRRIGEASGRWVELWNVARTGSQSQDVLAEQLGILKDAKPSLVTLTVGANDILVPMYKCVEEQVDKGLGATCKLPDPLEVLPRLERNLRATLSRVADETSAPIAVTTYFNPFARNSRCGPGFADMGIGLLNDSIADVVAEFPQRATLIDLKPVFEGHGGLEPSGWFAPSPSGLSCAAIHPSPRGQDAIAHTIWTAIRSRLDFG